MDFKIWRQRIFTVLLGEFKTENSESLIIILIKMNRLFNKNTGCLNKFKIDD